MTEAALTAAINSLIANGVPISAAIHRAAETLIIGEMYDAQSRGDVLASVQIAVSNNSGDEVLILRSGQLYRILKSTFLSVDGGTP